MTRNSDFFYRSGRVCCIPGCYNCQYINIEYEYYSFPSSKYELDRKRQWIDAVKQVLENKTWMPNRYTRICSAHFAGGKKSAIKHEEAYVPTIFPGMPKRKNQLEFISVTPNKTFLDSEADKSASTDPLAEKNVRAEVNQETIKYCQNKQDQILADKSLVFHMKEELIINDEQLSQSCRANINENALEPELIVTNKKILEITEGCTPNTQENLSISKQMICVDNVDEIIKVCTAGIEKGLSDYKAKSSSKVTLKTKKIKGFLGLEGIADERALRERTGVSPDTFMTLVKLQEGRGNQESVVYEDGTAVQMLVIREHKQSIKIHNAMLLFLMKIKCGSSFSDLGSKFDVLPKTASKIFLNLLNVLVGCTKSCIFWPAEVGTNGDNYPSIACIEIPVETPNRIEPRIWTYSRCKGVTTVKFLIAITLDGVICKVSQVFGGRISNEYIATEYCKFSAFSEHEVIDGRIPAEKIQVQKAIERVKASRILSYIPFDLLPYLDDIVHMCCIFANSQLSLTN